MRILLPTAITLAMLALGMNQVGAQSGNDLFQQALVKQRTAGNLPEAIKLYQTIVDTPGTDRALVARALVQMGQCYESLGRTEALAAYQRVAREFGDQKASVAAARTRIAMLQSPAAAQTGQFAQRQIWDDVDESESGPIGVSADGRYLSFTDGASLDLIVRDLRAGTNRHLTNTKPPGSGDYAIASLVSPDGRFVAYGWETRGPYELRILPVSGPLGEPRIVHLSKDTRYVWPVGWSPDGKNLLVHRRVQDGTTWQIAVISLSDGSMRTVKSFDRPEPLKVSWSPDGKWIAYDRPGGIDATAARDIFLIATDGSGETVVAASPAEDRWPVWSADGSQILFVSDRSGKAALWSVQVVEGQASRTPELIRVKADVGYLLGITQSGALHYVTRDQSDRIYSVDVDTNMRAKRPPVLATDRYINSNVYPAGSPDGRFLAFVSLRGMTLNDSPDSAVIVIRTLATGEDRDFRSILPSIRGQEGLRWFPDGRSLLVRSQPDRVTNTVGFYRVDAAGGKAELLLQRGNERGVSDLSSDGRSIFYVDRSQAPGKLMRFDLESRREQAISTAPVAGNNIVRIAVSPDGAQLALQVQSHVGVMPVSGGEPRPIGSDISTFSWTPDQRYLLVVLRGGELCRIPASGGEREKLGVKGQIQFPELDPSGQRITYQMNEASASTLWVLENFLPKAAPKVTKAGGSK
jgi:Tol biopolymer transport system component